MTPAELEAAAAGAAAAVAAAVGGGLMGGMVRGEGPEQQRHAGAQGAGSAGGEGSSFPAPSPSWGGCKWFVGHKVPCGSDGAALELQQLLERACQRVETLLASSAWPRQLML